MNAMLTQTTNILYISIDLIGAGFREKRFECLVILIWVAYFIFEKFSAFFH
jgi:hypothetical protein